MTFEDELKRTGYLIYTITGVSMMPLLRQKKDIIGIKRKEATRCNKYDVVLYKRGQKYILHRILKVRPEDYVIAGDNCTVLECGVTDNQILGVMTRVYRNGKEIHMTDMRYRLYMHLWCDCYPVRMAILRGKSLVRRGLEKAKRLMTSNEMHRRSKE